jgi:hypothetical protein
MSKVDIRLGLAVKSSIERTYGRLCEQQNPGVFFPYFQFRDLRELACQNPTSNLR